MCILCSLFGRKLMSKYDVPPMTATFILPKSICSDEDLVLEMMDWECFQYITRDGNCLLHAVSRALWGVELYYDILRRLMATELRTNQEWYKKVIQFEEKDFTQALQQADNANQHLQFLHVFALANVLKRPVIIYASDADCDRYGQGEGGVSATFLPTRHPIDECKARPLAISWSTIHKNHYVPVVVKEGHKFEWPIPTVAWKNSIPDGHEQEEYIHQNAEVVSSDVNSLIDQEQETLRDKRRKAEEHGTAHSTDIDSAREAWMRQIARQFGGEGKQIVFLDREDEVTVQAPDYVVSIQFTNSSGKKKTVQLGCHIFDYPPDVAYRLLSREGLIDQKMITKVNDHINAGMMTYYNKYSWHLPIRAKTIIPDNRSTVKIVEKIDEFNRQLLEKAATRSLALSDVHMQHLRNLAHMIQTQPLESTTFSGDEYSVFLRLLRWDDTMIFPVIHLARLLLMFDHGTEFYIRHQDAFTRTLKAAKATNCSKANRLLSLKLLLSLLTSELTRGMLIKSNFPVELIAAAIEDVANFPSVIDLTITCLMNWAQLLMVAPHYATDGAQISTIEMKLQCTTLILTVLQNVRSAEPNEANTDNMYHLLQSLGTLIYHDVQAGTLMMRMRVLDVMNTFADYPSDKVRAVINDFIRFAGVPTANYPPLPFAHNAAV